MKFWALEEARKMANGLLQTLSRNNITSNMMREGIEVITTNLIDTLKSEDSNAQRASVIVAAMSAIELAKQNRFKDALKELSKEVKRSETETDTQRVSLSILQKLLVHYPSLRTGNLFVFYNFILPLFPLKLAKLSAGAAKTFYEGNTYEKVALSINTNEEASIHRTIHKAKGAEFENVLLILGRVRTGIGVYT